MKAPRNSQFKVYFGLNLNVETNCFLFCSVAVIIAN